MRKRNFLQWLCCLLALAGSGAWIPADAAVTLPSIFSEHAVLQRQPAVPVWGRAAPGEAVSVRLGAVAASTQADASGRWRVLMDLSQVDDASHQLVVEGTNRITIDDVIVGDVWLCSGQSNMEWTLSGADDAATELARPRNSRLRQFTVKRSMANTPQENCEGSWIVASPETAAQFSAVAYHFGRSVQRETGTAIGLINASWGGTPIEVWLSPEAVGRDPELAVANRQNLEREARRVDEQAKFVARGEAWEQQFDRRSAPAADVSRFTSKPALGDPNWQMVNLPEGLAKASLPRSGAIWLVRSVQVPEKIDPVGLDRGFLINFGAMAGFDQVYWNGIKIGESSWQKPPAAGPRRYAVPRRLLRPGEEGTLAIRIFNPLDSGFSLSVPAGSGFTADVVDLRGEWHLRVESTLPELPAGASAAYPRNAARAAIVPSRMFNGLIAPIAGYGLKGMLWYQGESNTPRSAQYARTFPALISDWRERWQAGDLPFYFCQLANAKAKMTKPGESGWAELREAQAKALRLPQTGMAVLIDIGEADDLHPRDKRTAGDRLARVALAGTYGRPIVSSGPRFKEMTSEGSILRVRFVGTDGGLTARSLPATYRPRSTGPQILPLKRNSPASPLEGFSLCGADGRWVWADSALIEGYCVLVSSRQVDAPVALRYGWADNPTCNLYNGAGLPAAPFRTDSYPLSTATAKF